MSTTGKTTGRISVTRQFEFAYAHHLPDYNGKCCQMHGHNAQVEVTVSCSVEDFIARRERTSPDVRYADGIYSGMVMDFSEIKAAVDPLLKSLDHSMLNGRPLFAGVTPTAENTAILLAAAIEHHMIYARGLPLDLRLERVRVYETPNNYAEWTA